MEIKFKRDTSFRKRFFVPASFAHPAKMDAQLLLWIVNRYSKEGETILDPMAGSGTLMLGCTMGRNVILVELEDKFCNMMRDNWEQVKMMPQLGFTMGSCQIIQGDARQLEGLVDKIITSPPYSETGACGPSRSPFWKRLADDPTSARYGRVNHPSVGQEYSNNPSNIGNLPYGTIDNIITSPPYENQIHKGSGEWSKSSEGRLLGGENSEGGKMLGIPQGEDYIKSQDNIGNLKSDTYLEAMLQVYQQCHKILRPCGLMILVTKNFIRDKQIVRLDEDTIKLCEQVGFSFVERHYRKLPAQSFWRVIYHQKYPDVKQIKHEDVLVFSRG